LSIGLLLGQNLVLPLLIGTEEFGKLAFVLASSALLYAIYDHGYNLLIIRKQNFHVQFMLCKLELFAAFSVCYILFWLFSGSEQMLHPALVIPHALSMTIFTYVIYFLMAGGRMRQAALFSIVLALIGLLTPLLFVFTQVPIIFAPLVSTMTSLLIGVVFFRDLPILLFVRNFPKYATKRLGFRYRWRLFSKQAQISAGTIIDGLIVWSGVYFIALFQGPHEAAVFRISMSIITLMSQAIPIFKPTYLRLSRSTQNFMKLALFSGSAVLCVGLLQWAFLLFFGMPILLAVFTESAPDIFDVIMPLALVPALKVILELQTVLFDRRNLLSYQFWSVAIALPVTLGYAWKYQSIVAIFIFYLVLCLSNGGFLFRMFRPDAR